MNNQFLLVQGTTTQDGPPLQMQGRDSTAVFLQAYLSAAGGTATCTVEGRMNGGPWVELRSFGLSGANDSSSYILDIENWFELRGRITAISSATATVVAGV